MYRLNRARLLGHKLTIVLTILIFLLATIESSPDESKYNKILPRLGYFASFGDSHPIKNIFEDYYEFVLKPADSALLSVDPFMDYRPYRPTPRLCVDKLLSFVVNNYTPKIPIEMIPIDACLELVLSERKDREVFNKAEYETLTDVQKSEMDNFKNNAKLRAFYGGTNFRSGGNITVDVIDKVNDYLRKLLRINVDSNFNNCDGHWMKAYLDFIEDDYLTKCEGEPNCHLFGHEGVHEDPYLKALVDSTTMKAKSCVEVINTNMLDLMSKEFDRIKARASLISDEAQTQSNKKKWSRPMMRILQIVQGVGEDQAVDLFSVARSLNSIKPLRLDAISDFKQALSKYAVTNVDMENSANDPDGTLRWRRGMAKLCQPYIDESIFMALFEAQNKPSRPLDYYNLVNSMVRMTNHDKLFGLTKEQFQDGVMLYKWDPLYFATLSCQIISTSIGTVTKLDKKFSFAVDFKPGARSQFEDWPLDKFLETYPAMSADYAKKRESHHTMARFGKFTQNIFSRSPGKDKVAANESDSDTSASSKGVLSLECIQYWKDLKGKYPREVPPNVHQLYPELPADLTKTSKPLDFTEMSKKWPKGPPVCFSGRDSNNQSSAGPSTTSGDSTSAPAPPQPPVEANPTEPAPATVQQQPQPPLAAPVMPPSPFMQSPLMAASPLHPSMMAMSPLHASMMQPAALAPSSPARDSAGTKKKADSKSGAKKGLLSRFRKSKKDEDDEDNPQESERDRQLQQLRDQHSMLMNSMANPGASPMSPYAGMMMGMGSGMGFANPMQAMQNAGQMMPGMSNLVGLQTVPGLANMQQMAMTGMGPMNGLNAMGAMAGLPGAMGAMGAVGGLAGVPGMTGMQNGLSMAGANFGQMGGAGSMQMGQMYTPGANDWNRMNANFMGPQANGAMGQQPHFGNAGQLAFNGNSEGNNYSNQNDNYNSNNHDQRNHRHDRNNRPAAKYQDRDDYDDDDDDHQLDDDYDQRASRGSRNGAPPRDRRGSPANSRPPARGSQSSGRRTSSGSSSTGEPARRSRGHRVNQEEQSVRSGKGRRATQRYQDDDDDDDDDDYDDHHHDDRNYHANGNANDRYDDDSDTEGAGIQGLVSTQTRKANNRRRS